MTENELPDRLLLLYSDRSDPVSAILLDQSARFDREVVALSLDQLVSEVAFGNHWEWSGRAIAPSRTAVVNRLVVPDASNAAHPLATYAAERRFWSWLHRELRRFAYASSLPTPTSLTGCYGSLLDQWLDVPGLVGGLRVPTHRRPWSDDALPGDAYCVDPWHLYSLGTPLAKNDAASGQLAYVRPSGKLLHVAQVGGLLMFAHLPPEMSPRQQSYIVSFANALASQSTIRILEHAFFVGDDLPVFYSTCPWPVITGSMPDYPELLVQGLQDDVARRGARAASQAR